MKWERLLGRLQTSVRCASLNPPGLEAELAHHLIAWLDQAGIIHETVPLRDDPTRFNVIARVPATVSHPHNPLVFTGHLDVVPISEEEQKRWKHDPFGAQIDQERLWGRGSSDMKAGLCCALETLCYAAEQVRAGAQLTRDLVLAATVDEEFKMRGSRALIGHPWLPRGAELLVCEPTDGQICQASRGRAWAEVTVYGQTSHGSRPGGGANALHGAAALIQAVEATDWSDHTHPLSGATFWQVLKIEAGQDPGIVPDRCRLEVDARLSLASTSDDFEQRLKAVIKTLETKRPGLKVTYRVVDRREPWTAPMDQPLFKQLQALDPQAPIGCFTGSTDGNIFGGEGGLKPIIYGPGDLNCVHREEESVSLEDVAYFARIYEALVDQALICSSATES